MILRLSAVGSTVSVVREYVCTDNDDYLYPTNVEVVMVVESPIGSIVFFDRPEKSQELRREHYSRQCAALHEFMALSEVYSGKT